MLRFRVDVRCVPHPPCHLWALFTPRVPWGERWGASTYQQESSFNEHAIFIHVVPFCITMFMHVHDIFFFWQKRFGWQLLLY